MPQPAVHRTRRRRPPACRASVAGGMSAVIDRGLALERAGQRESALPAVRTRIARRERDVARGRGTASSPGGARVHAGRQLFRGRRLRAGGIDGCRTVAQRGRARARHQHPGGRGVEAGQPRRRQAPLPAGTGQRAPLRRSAAGRDDVVEPRRDLQRPRRGGRSAPVLRVVALRCARRGARRSGHRRALAISGSSIRSRRISMRGAVTWPRRGSCAR